MRARRGVLGVVCAVVMTALAAACSGGADDPVGDAPVDAGIPAPTGVSADRSAANAIAALGPPGPVDPRSAAHTLRGSDAIGGMRDVFVPRVRPGKGGDGGGGGPTTAADAPDPPASPAAATLTVPSVPIPTPVPAPPAPVAAPAAPAAPTATMPAAPAAPADTTSGWRAAGGAVVEADPGAATGRLMLRAELDIDGEIVVADEGDAVPPASQAFTVVSISAAAVVLRLEGGLLADGRDTITLALGEEVTLQNAVSGRASRLTLVGVRTL